MTDSDLLGTRVGTRKAQNYAPNASLATPGFDPKSLVTGGGDFWRADAGVATSGSNVTSWTGRQNSIALASSGTNPTFSSTGFNTSFPGITFGTSGSPALTLASQTFNSTTFSVWGLLNSATLQGARVFSAMDPNDAHDYLANSTEISPNSGGHIEWASNFTTTLLGNGGTGPAISASTIYAFGGIANGSTAQNVYLNFTVQGSATTQTILGVGGHTGSVTMGMGCNSSTSTTAGNMVLAYVLFTSKVLTAGDLTNLKTWTNSNWGTSF